jgi:hypothetical protein
LANQAETAQAIRDLANKHSVPLSNIIWMRTVSEGKGAVDILKCKGFVNNSRPLPVEGQIAVQYQNQKHNVILSWLRLFKQIDYLFYVTKAQYSRHYKGIRAG